MSSEPNKGLEDKGLFKSVGSGFVSLFGLQLVSRVLTFTLNVAIARNVDRSAYGQGAVQLQLISDAILMLSREGFRDALQRTPAADWHDQTKRARMLRVVSLSIPLSLVVAVIVLGTGALSGGESTSGPGVRVPATLFALAATVEMAAEPLYVLAHNLLLIRIRVWAEMAALAVRVGVVAGCVWLRPQEPLMAFAAGQLCYGATVLACLASYFSLSKEHGMGLRRLLGAVAGGWGKEGIDWGLVGMCATMGGKTLVKFAMERGETLVLLSIFKPDVWAAYSIVQNLGSLVVRLLLFPIEDMAQLLFSKLCSANDRESAGAALSVILRLVALIGVLCASFGPAYSFTVIHILYGTRWSDSTMPGLLSWYSWYIPLLAINGVTEAFLHASASSSQIAARSFLLMPTTAAYLVVSYILAPHLGVSSLIIGNMVHLAIRIFLSLRHITNFLPATFRLSSSLPASATLMTLVGSGLIGYAHDVAKIRGGWRQFQGGLVALAMHVLLALVLLPICAGGLWRWERQLWAEARALMKERAKRE